MNTNDRKLKRIDFSALIKSGVLERRPGRWYVLLKPDMLTENENRQIEARETRDTENLVQFRSWKNRGRGEGSIFFRRDGRYCATLTLPNGKRKSYYSHNRKDVRAKLNEALGKVEQGFALNDDRITVERFLHSWLAAICPTVRFKTYQFYETTVRLHLLPALGKLALRRLTSEVIQTFLNERNEAKEIGDRTVRAMHQALSACLRKAVRWKKLTQNPMDGVDCPVRHTATKVIALTQEQAAVFRGTATLSKFATLFELAILLGMRRGELLGLVWDKIDFDTKKVKVDQALQRVKGEDKLVEPKTKRSRRVIPLTEGLVGLLREHRRQQLEARMRAGSNWRDPGFDFVFRKDNGSLLEPEHLRREFKRLLKLAGLPDFPFNSLRHTAATLALLNGTDYRSVSDLLGHSTPSTTLNVYTNSSVDSVRSAVERVDRASRGKGD